MSDQVRITGPNGVSGPDKLFKSILESSGMSLVLHSDLNAQLFMRKILEIHPELERSGVTGDGYFGWERHPTTIIWCLVSAAEDDDKASAIFIPGSTNMEKLPRMFLELQNGAKSHGISYDGIFSGDSSQETATRINNSKFIAAQTLLA